MRRQGIHITVFITLAFAFSAQITSAQTRMHIPLYRAAMFGAMTEADSVGSSLHPGVHPYRAKDVKNTEWYLHNMDSNYLIDRILPEMHILKEKKNPIQFNVYPLAVLTYGIEHDFFPSPIHETSIGVHSSMQVGDKLDVHFNWIQSNSVFDKIHDGFASRTNTLPGLGYAHSSGLGYHARHSNGAISYSPSKYFNFELGRGKNFFGEGYRSLIFSDFAPAHDYFRITTSFGRFKYINLWTSMRDIYRVADAPNNFNNKYGAFHLLSWNVSKRFNITVFEAVIWQGQDSLVNRQFDVHYLNPIIFYRPIEFSLGSPDNMLLGATASLFVTKKLKAYTQILLDEFKIDNIRQQNGWHGNKYAIQGGLKYYNAFNKKGLMLLGEMNVVRPFMYTHNTSSQSYSHLNQALAHPLGANFIEGVFMSSYLRKRFQFEYKLSVAVQGKNNFAMLPLENLADSLNWGDDILREYNTNRVSDYGNWLLQGSKYILVTNRIQASYLISSKSQLRLETELMWWRASQGVSNFETVFARFGLRMNIFNSYNDF